VRTVYPGETISVILCEYFTSREIFGPILRKKKD
jgi:hypothetical protein